jgi:hypothetical protein
MVSNCAIVIMVVDSADGVELCNCNDGGGWCKLCRAVQL